jgi:hypothetical protein
MATAELGLSLILIGLLFQTVSVWKGKKDIQSRFLYAYVTGCMILSIDGLSSGSTTLGILNLGCVLLAATILIKLK